MAQQSDTGGLSAALARQQSSPEPNSDGTFENLSIFSAPALELVSRWWLDSNRRWTERNVAPGGTGFRDARSFDDPITDLDASETNEEAG